MLLILDIDGIFTDGKHYYGKSGKVMKSFGSNDRFIINLVKNQNFFEDIICVTGDNTGNGIEISKYRVEQEIKLKVVSVKQAGYHKKYDYLCETYGKQYLQESIVYIGDDLADLKIIKDCFWSATTANAHFIVKKHCDYVSDYDGGNGGLSDILIKYMELQGIDVESLLLQ